MQRVNHANQSIRMVDHIIFFGIIVSISGNIIPIPCIRVQYTWRLLHHRLSCATLWLAVRRIFLLNLQEGSRQVIILHMLQTAVYTPFGACDVYAWYKNVYVSLVLIRFLCFTISCPANFRRKYNKK